MKKFRPIFLSVISALLLTTVVSAADQRSQDLYKAKCQSCHGADGMATAIGKKLGARDFQDPDVRKTTEADLAKIIEQGKNKMPSYKGKLTQAQIQALASYIREMK
jgi:cytochrome c6